MMLGSNLIILLLLNRKYLFLQCCTMLCYYDAVIHVPLEGSMVILLFPGQRQLLVLCL